MGGVEATELHFGFVLSTGKYPRLLNLGGCRDGVLRRDFIWEFDGEG